MVDPSHPFPFISGLSLNLAIVLAAPPAVIVSTQAGAGGTTVPNGLPSLTAENRLFARVKVPPRLPRFLRASQDRYVPIEDVIAAHLAQLFGGLRIIEHYVFRVTRVRELEVDEEFTENLLQAMERELIRRRFDPAVRLEVTDDMPDAVLWRLVKEARRR